MALHITVLLLSLIALYFGAEWLVKGSVQLALRLGLSPLVIGLTVVAFGTSSPELFVSIKAAFAGSPDVAVGNIVGSNICNIGLILGMGALVRPLLVKSQIVKREIPFLLFVSVLFVYFMPHFGIGEGAVLMALLIAYVTLSIRWARRSDPMGSEFASELAEERAEVEPLWMSLLLVGTGLLTLMAGAHFLVDSGSFLARTFGVSDAVIGLTIVAVGTSLPELATSIVAARRGEGDIVIGNAVGSCLFNLLAVIGLTALIHPITSQNIQWIDLGTMLFFTALILPLMITQQRLSRVEGGLIIGCYAGYYVLLSLSHSA